VHVVRVVREVQAPDATGTDMRAMASSQIEMAKKQLDMADAAVNRAKQEQDMASEAITRSKQEQENAAQAMERSKREIEQMKARAEREIADAKARADQEIAEARLQAERKIAAQITEASRLRQTAIELQDYLTQKIGEEKRSWKRPRRASARRIRRSRTPTRIWRTPMSASMRPTSRCAPRRTNAGGTTIACANSWTSRPS
jgi:hypothetical protein